MLAPASSNDVQFDEFRAILDALDQEDGRDDLR
jgi:hypothetical protein